MLTVCKLYIYKLLGAFFMLYEYLKKNYRPGEPIFTGDISISGLSDENLRYHLKKLTDDGILHRFDAGIYYFPRTDIFGEKMDLTTDMVVRHKYIQRRGRMIGYYSGYTLANRMGISTQVPLKEEITSNFAPAQIRELTIKGHKYVLRRPAVEVTDENVAVLQFLDCLKDLEKCAEAEPAVCGQILTDYATKHALTKTMVDRFLVNYPLKIYKAIYETGVKYVSA